MSLVHEVTAQLVELIASSSSSLVALPSEHQLCRELQVSRGVVREALAALQEMGLVEIHGKARVGLPPRARVRRLSQLATDGPARELFAEPFEAWRIIAPETAACAAARATPETLAEVERWIESIARGVLNGQGVVDYECGFHVAIARATLNQMLVDIVVLFNEALRRSREASLRRPAAMQAALEQHRAILAALRVADRDAARRAMEAHVVHVDALIRSDISAPAGDRDS